MNANRQRLAVIGIGSPHGDDQFGWSVVDELNRRFGMEAQKISSPIEILSLLDELDRIILIDAAIGLPNETSYQRLDYGDAEDRETIEAVASRGTHDIGLHQTLQMAVSLGKPIAHIEIWIGRSDAFEPLSPMSSETAYAARHCAVAIAKECCDARTIAG